MCVMNKYILFNGKEYVYFSDTKKTMKTNKMNDAYKFNSLQKAKRELTKRSKKLKGFSVYLYKKDFDLEKIDDNIKLYARQNISQNKRREVFLKGNCHCYICGEKLDYDDFTVDHVKPLSRGGDNHLSNLLPVCDRCNQLKSDCMEDELYEMMANIILYQMSQRTDSKYKMDCMKKWLSEMSSMQ